MIKNNKKTENILEFILFGLFAFVLLYFCTGSSFRYAINPWYDSNAFFTVGKGMANGIVPYRDVFEQKGPLLYFIHCCSYWISNTSFAGVYIFEAVLATVFMIYIYKMARLYLNKPLSYATSILTFTFVCNSFCFYYGDSAEEFALPTMAIGLYYLLKYFKNSEDIKLPIYLFTGFLAGCLVMMKFTLIGFWFGWMAIICIDKLFVKKEVKKAFIIGFVFIAGMIIACIPWFIYFAVNNSLKDFINVYFVINSTCYADNNSIFTKAIDFVYYYKERLLAFPLCTSISTVGFIIPLFFKFFSNGKLLSRFAVTFAAGCSLFFIYFGGVNFSYYFLPITVFSCFAIVSVLSLVQKIFKKDSKKAFSIGFDIIITVIVVLCCANFNPVAKTLEHRSEKVYQKQIAEYIDAHNPNATVLNYNSLDLGIYMFNNYTKLFEHFERQNINYEKFSENIDEQNRYINEHEAYYVVAQSQYNNVEEIYKENSTLRDDYNLCMVVPYTILTQGKYPDTITQYCFLFELKDNV